MDMKPWYSICTPHKDIRDGNLDEATFAVDLWGVVTGNGPEVYLSPEEFFEKTYPTEGLKKVIERTLHGISGKADSGDRILSLQTSFGGGKTHLLLALYHLAKSSGKIKSLGKFLKASGVDSSFKRINTAVFTNKTCDATQGRTLPDGTHTYTIWGEIAYQLGGKELYSIVEANDKARTVPQGLFVQILQKASPCLILIDELADYCVGASGVKVGSSTLADQTNSFVQQITEAVGLVKGSMVVATLPASNLEVGGGERGQEILQSLEKRFGRMAADTKPVQDKEIFAVVRKRLFDSIGTEEQIKEIAKSFHEMYRDHQSEVPSDATKATYRQLMEESYPFHPELIQMLYHRWGSHNDFQRTRGVLRLLGVLVADLWNMKNATTQSQSLIQPRHVNWSLDAWAGNLTRLWGNGYQSVVAADVTGSNSNSMLLDRERDGDYEREAISEGVASAILLGSFGAQPDRAGLNEKDIKLACTHPGVNWNYTDGALVGLEQQSFYLHTTSGTEKRYWYNTKPTINQLIVRYRSSQSTQTFDDQIEETLRKQSSSLSTNWKVLINPGFDLAEQKSLTLVVLPASISLGDSDADQVKAKENISRISRFCGSRERLFRNTLLFLLTTPSGNRSLQNAFREVATIEAVLRDYGSQLDGEQKAELKSRIESARKLAEESFSASYLVLARVQKDEVNTLSVTEPRLGIKPYFDSLWKTAIEQDWIHQKVGVVEFERSGLVPKDNGIRVKDAVESFLRYTDKPMVPSVQVVYAAIQAAVVDSRVGLGQGTSLSNLQRRWCKENPFVSWEDDGLWIIPPFEKNTTTLTADGSTQAPKEGGSITTFPPGAASPTPIVGEQKGKTIRRIVISGDVPLESWSDVFRSFIHPSTQLNLKKQKLTVRFEFEAKEGSPIVEDNKVKAMKESANQLGLEFQEE